MASDKLLLHEPQWTDPDIRWYISNKQVKRIIGKSGSAPAGTIFEVDYKNSKLDEKQEKEIVLKSCQKGSWQVKWVPRTFYELDNDSKDLLLAISDQNDRLRFYDASRQHIEYGKTLKTGDDVCVWLPKKKDLQVEGVIKYKGPVEKESSAVWFGVELVGISFGDTDGVFRKTGHRFFNCEQGRGLFVTIKNIVPSTVRKEQEQKLFLNFKTDDNASSGSSHAPNSVRLKDIPQTPLIKVGDEVMLRTQMKRGEAPPLVLGHVVLVHGNHVAVNVLKSENVLKPWNGHYKGEKLYHDVNKHTVWLERSQVESCHSPTSSASSRDKGLDNGTVHYLSRKLCFDWPLLAYHFDYRREEISRRLGTGNHVDMSLIVLKEWLCANGENSTENIKAKLKNGLIAIGRKDLVEWMQKRVEEDVEEKLEMPSYEKQGGAFVDSVVFSSQGVAVGEASVPAHQNLNVNSMVEVTWGSKILPGVIQWIGVMKGLEEHGKIAGVELEEFAEIGAGSGKFGDTRYFDCQYGRGLFVPLSRCRPDSRFLTETETCTSKENMDKEDFGDIECDPVEGYVRPSETIKPEHIGMFKGIQGDHNSSYMDVTLFSMFAFSDILDAVLHYEDTAKPGTKNIIDTLRESIVNPLRNIGVVRADHVHRFRDLLSCFSSMEGFRTEEKDPEEFIHALFQELLNAKPFLNITQGKSAAKESFVYQISTDKTKYLDIPTVEDLLHVSFLKSDLKLSEVPECFIIRLPRYEKKYKVYDWIIPSLEIDINLLIRDSPRPCCACGHLAIMECRECTPQHEDDDIILSFCTDCFSKTHELKSKQQHQINYLTIPGQFAEQYQQIARRVGEDKLVTETYHLYEKRLMELFSVVCIKTSHYVAFVKTGSGEHAQWVFFDSMADRRGDQHGYNVPEVTHLRYFETEMRREDLKDVLKRNKDLSKILKRLLSDAYICFYRPTKSGDDISPRGRTRKCLEGGREQNVHSTQGATLNAGANLSQQKYENLPRSLQESHVAMKFLREVQDLQGQLEQMKTKHADTVKGLEEAQKMMLTFKSKNAELEEELHHTKLNLASQQQEIERLKKELKDGKKQTCSGNEPVEESPEGYSGDASSPVGMRESRSLEGFGKFQFHLSSYLTRDIIRKLMLVLDFSLTVSEQAEDDTIKFIRVLRGKGIISPTDITQLTNALYEIDQHGVLDAVKKLFDRRQTHLDNVIVTV